MTGGSKKTYIKTQLIAQFPFPDYVRTVLWKLKIEDLNTLLIAINAQTAIDGFANRRARDRDAS